jgi:glutamate-ammonia-ligase adenylyltransferase
MTSQWQQIYQDWCDKDSDGLNPAQHKQVARTIAVSAFFKDQIAKHPQWLSEFALEWQAPSDPELRLRTLLATCDDDVSAMKVLRDWRNWYQCWMILCDINRLTTTQETTAACTQLAEAAVRMALQWAQPRLEKRFGVPQECPYQPGQPQSLSVIAMGKMGARELNLSSDIDLILAYPTEGDTQGDKAISHSDFFIRLGQHLVRLLDTLNGDGFVFRVDLRLRPWGQSGPLATNFNFIRKYYPEQGRDWERFAMIKARVIAGPDAAAEALKAIFQDFVYRRYVDYQALEVLRDMKQMIIKEVSKHGRENNIKLGRGGIREIEFIAQAVQLIRGGQLITLRDPHIWHVFQCIRDEGLLPVEVIDTLIAHYEFLRNCEHALQAWQDRQTQALPDATDSESWSRLAFALNLDSAEALQDRLKQVQDDVSLHFNAFIQTEQSDQEDSDTHWPAVWQGTETDADVPDTTFAAIQAFRNSQAVARMQPQSRERLDRFMPVAIKGLSVFKNPDLVWERFQPLLEAILRRTSYLLLLAEQPPALRQMFKMLGLSTWVATQLSQKPFLLDEFSDQKGLFRLPNRMQLSESLHKRLVRLPEDDLEAQMETLRHFRHGRVLRAATCELNAVLPLMKISDYLAYTAEVVVEQSFWLAWEQLTAKFGRPMRSADVACDTDFGIVGYGKLGGLELSYESDLDLVFLYQANSHLETEGPKVVDNGQFFTRLGQKIIHILTTQTQSGDLYDVDMRLRPSGNKGLLVSTLDAFARYQKTDAWTWEHQALVRARFVAGDDDLKANFAQVRHDILCLPRELEPLQTAVRDMRHKMRDHLATSEFVAEQSDLFNLKQDPGGIVDIEFIVQFGVLAWAQYYPDLTRWSDNVRILEDLRTVGFLSDAETEQLLTAYLAFREKAHAMMLQKASVKALSASALTDLAPHRANVTAVWQRVMEGAIKAPAK